MWESVIYQIVNYIHVCKFDTTNSGKFLKRWEYQTTWPASWQICMQVRKQQLNWTWNNRLVPNGERSKSKYCHLRYLTYMQGISCKNAGLDEARAGIKIARRNINNFRYADDTILMAESEELKSLLMKWKRRVKSWLKTQHSENFGLKLNIQKLRSWNLVPSLHGN